MVLSAMIVLGLSILGLIVLFYVKHWEEKHARIFVPSVRLAADQRALEIKSFLQRCEGEFRKLGPTSLRVSRVLLHDLALTLAALSRASERQAHRLADLVSHKHRFERRETKSEFLKQVGETPIRNIRDVAAPIPADPVPSAPAEIPNVEATPVAEIPAETTAPAPMQENKQSRSSKRRK